MPTIFIFCKLTRTSDPKLPPSRGLGGINKYSQEMSARAGSSLVFRSKSDGWLNANHFYYLQTDSHERPQVAPYQGVRGCKNSSREMPANAGSWLVFRSKSKSFKDKIKQNPLKHRFRGFFIYCRSASFRHRGAPTRHSPNLEVSLRISSVKIRDTYSEKRGHFDNLGQKNQLLANFSTTPGRSSA